MCGTIATSMSSLLKEPTDIGFPLINSSYQKTFDIPDELCNGTDIVKVTFRLTVGDLIDSEAVAKYNELKLDNIYIQNKVCQYS